MAAPDNLYVTDGGHQPKSFTFPKRSFGTEGEKRAFNLVGAISKWSWLDYIEVNNHVVCFYCSCANRRNLLPNGFCQKHEETYVTRGFTNWKDACESFKVRIIF